MPEISILNCSPCCSVEIVSADTGKTNVSINRTSIKTTTVTAPMIRPMRFSSSVPRSNHRTMKSIIDQKMMAIAVRCRPAKTAYTPINPIRNTILPSFIESFHMSFNVILVTSYYRYDYSNYTELLNFYNYINKNIRYRVTRRCIPAQYTA